MVTTPCNLTCELDDNVCTSCNRTLEDILQWGSMTEAERKERMAELRVES
jgi:hypothetical protein